MAKTQSTKRTPARAKPPAKAKAGKKPETKQEKKAEGEAAAWSHAKRRCPRCRTILKSAGTRDGGRLQRYEQCQGRPPIGCGYREKDKPGTRV